jgi:hypothetical protein
MFLNILGDITMKKNKKIIITIIIILALIIISLSDYRYVTDDPHEGKMVRYPGPNSIGVLDESEPGIAKKQIFVDPVPREQCLIIETYIPTYYITSDMKRSDTGNIVRWYGSRCEAGERIAMYAWTSASGGTRYRLFNHDYLKESDEDNIDLYIECDGGNCYNQEWYRDRVANRYVGYECLDCGDLNICTHTSQDDMFTKGTLTVGDYTYTDYCESTNYLRKWSCYKDFGTLACGGQCSFKSVDCQTVVQNNPNYKCENGRCVSTGEPAPTYTFNYKCGKDIGSSYGSNVVYRSRSDSPNFWVDVDTCNDCYNTPLTGLSSELTPTEIQSHFCRTCVSHVYTCHDQNQDIYLTSCGTPKYKQASCPLGQICTGKTKTYSSIQSASVLQSDLCYIDITATWKYYCSGSFNIMEQEGLLTATTLGQCPDGYTCQSEMIEYNTKQSLSYVQSKLCNYTYVSSCSTDTNCAYLNQECKTGFCFFGECIVQNKPNKNFWGVTTKCADNTGICVDGSCITTTPTTPGITINGCVYSAWTPASSTVKSGEEFTQTRTVISGTNCDAELQRTVTGTKPSACLSLLQDEQSDGSCKLSNISIGMLIFAAVLVLLKVLGGMGGRK